MVFGTKRRPRTMRAALGLMALTWLALPASLWAFECRALDANNVPRDCTALEDLGECMAAADDSRRQCVSRNNTLIWGWYRCQEDAAIDMAACILISPFRVIMR